MAFRRTDKDIPEVVTFPDDLAELGFSIDKDGQIRKIEHPHDFFKFEEYEKYETNQQRYNAMHKAVRKEVAKRLANSSVKLYHLFSNVDGPQIEVNKPALPSIKIFASPRFSVLEHKEVYLVIGDSNQDLGVWSRKLVLTEGGLFHGSAVGLVETLRDITGHSQTTTLDEDTELELPAVMILNPGELLYSQKLEENMSSTSWQDRKREHAFADQYKISEEHNKVPDHAKPEQHVRTFLRNYLPKMIASNTRLNIITIGDGSESLLPFLDQAYTLGMATGELLETFQIAIAMVQPSHDASIVTSPALQDMLAKHGRAWETHSDPKDTVIAEAPKLRSPKKDLAQGEVEKLKYDVAPLYHYDEPISTYKMRLDVLTQNQYGLRHPHTRLLCPPRGESSIKPIDMHRRTLEQEAIKVDQSPHASRAYTDWMKYELPKRLKTWGEKSTALLWGDEFRPENSAQVESTPKGSTGRVDSQTVRGYISTTPTKASSDEADKATKETILGSVDADKEAPDTTQATTSPTLESIAIRGSKLNLSTKPDGDADTTPAKEIQQQEEGTGWKIVDRTAHIPDVVVAGNGKIVLASDKQSQVYPFHKRAVNCQTLSAGIEDTADMIFPHVMLDVLKFLEEDKQKTKEKAQEGK